MIEAADSSSEEENEEDEKQKEEDEEQKEDEELKEDGDLKELGQAVSKDDPPVFVQPLVDVKASEGRPVVFECSLLASHDPMIMWYKNMQILRSGTEFQQSFDGKIARLKISEVSAEDAGRYECLARNSNGKASCICRLTIEGLKFIFFFILSCH